MAEDITADVRSLVIRHVENIRRGIVSSMAARGRNASGRSVASLSVEAGEGIGVSLWGAGQWGVMQKGRGPGKVPHNFRDIIRQWIVDKGISVSGRAHSHEANLNSMAYLIARSIREKGTSMYRKGVHDDIYDSVIDDEWLRLGDDVMLKMTTMADDVTDKWIREKGT